MQLRRLKNKSKVLEAPLKQKLKCMKSVQLKAGKNYYLRQNKPKRFNEIPVASICVFIVENKHHFIASHCSWYYTFVTLSESKFISVTEEALINNLEKFRTQYKTGLNQKLSKTSKNIQQPRSFFFPSVFGAITSSKIPFFNHGFPKFNLPKSSVDICCISNTSRACVDWYLNQSFR